MSRIEANQQAIVQKLMPSIGSTAWNGSYIVSFTSLDGTILGINGRFETISKYSRKELIGQNHRILKGQIVSHPSIKTWPEFWHILLEVGYVKDLVVKNVDKNGNYYYVKGDFKREVVDGEDYLISIRKDVTAEYQNIERLNLANIDEKQRANDAIELAAKKEDGRQRIVFTVAVIVGATILTYVISQAILRGMGIGDGEGVHTKDVLITVLPSLVTAIISYVSYRAGKADAVNQETTVAVK